MAAACAEAEALEPSAGSVLVVRSGAFVDPGVVRRAVCL